MRWHGLLVLAACTACAAHAPSPQLPRSPAEAPARDLATATAQTRAAPRASDTEAGDHLAAKDPRIVDLDIIRITAHGGGVGGEPDLEHVATADVFRDAGLAAKAGQTERALTLYRQIVSDFPESKYAPVALFDIAAVLDGRGDLDGTIATLRELVKTYPEARESVEGHLYVAALQAEHAHYAESTATLDEVLARTSLTYADRVEAFARKGYALLELGRLADADATLTAAIAEWRKAPHIDDPYYIAMASYYRGELAHRKFLDAPVRLPDDQLVADLEAKRVLAVQAYDLWKDSLRFHQAYWATASGYQMSQIFVELWQATVRAPYPARIDPATRPTYVSDVHARVHEHLEKALEGHRMNVELAKAYGVSTKWSEGSEQREVQIMDLLAKEATGQLEGPHQP